MPGHALGRQTVDHPGDVMEQGFLAPAPQFEPPADTVFLSRPTCRTARTLRRPRQSSHNGTSPPRIRHPSVAASDPIAAGADMFWNRSIRLVLETIDRRRSPAQLKDVLTPPVLELVTRLTVSTNPVRKLGGATVHRSHIQAVSENAAEVCATFNRGTHTFAVAGRIDRTDKTGWTVTALHVV